jgi:hypothetical protein
MNSAERPQCHSSTGADPRYQSTLTRPTLPGEAGASRSGSSQALAGGRDAPAGRPLGGLVGLETSGSWNPLLPELQRRRRLSRMRRAVLNSGDVLEAGYAKGGFRRRAVLLTLTYRDVGGWSGRHVSDLLWHCRKWAHRRRIKLGYVWTAELQKRGAVHYHVVLWLPRGLTLPKPDKQGWWRHGSTRIEWARKPVGYLCKYASKGDESQTLPRGLRLHGRGGLDPAQRLTVSWWLLPRYVREAFGIDDRATRAPGGGWVSRLTGEWLEGWHGPPHPA